MFEGGLAEHFLFPFFNLKSPVPDHVGGKRAVNEMEKKTTKKKTPGYWAFSGENCDDLGLFPHRLQFHNWKKKMQKTRLGSYLQGGFHL